MLCYVVFLMNFDNNEQCFVVIILCSSAELQNFM